MAQYIYGQGVLYAGDPSECFTLGKSHVFGPVEGMKIDLTVTSLDIKNAFGNSLMITTASSGIKISGDLLDNTLEKVLMTAGMTSSRKLERHLTKTVTESGLRYRVASIEDTPNASGATSKFTVHLDRAFATSLLTVDADHVFPMNFANYEVNWADTVVGGSAENRLSRSIMAVFFDSSDSLVGEAPVAKVLDIAAAGPVAHHSALELHGAHFAGKTLSEVTEMYPVGSYVSFGDFTDAQGACNKDFSFKVVYPVRTTLGEVFLNSVIVPKGQFMTESVQVTTSNKDQQKTGFSIMPVNFDPLDLGKTGNPPKDEQLSAFRGDRAAVLFGRTSVPHVC